MARGHGRQSGDSPRRRAQVLGLFAVITVALLPTVAMPAFKAATADPATERVRKDPGFSKTGIWKELDS